MTATTQQPPTGQQPSPVTKCALLQHRTLLVPTDFSESSRKALHYAQRLAQQFGSTVVLVHVIEPVYVYPVDGLMHFPGDLRDGNMERRPETEKALGRLGELTAREGNIAVRTMTRIGRAFDEITAAAREQKADLIVISTHGYSGVKHVVLGSVAERVVRHAPCPVLVVREHERDFVEPSKQP
jgi:universal stress protein A